MPIIKTKTGYKYGFAGKVRLFAYLRLGTAKESSKKCCAIVLMENRTVIEPY